MFHIILVVFREFPFVHIDAKPRPLDAAPARPVGDWNGFGEDIVGHELSGLLMTEAGIGRRKHGVVPSHCREAEFAVGVLANLPALEMACMNERHKAGQRAYPI